MYLTHTHNQTHQTHRLKSGRPCNERAYAFLAHYLYVCVRLSFVLAVCNCQ